MRTPLLYRVLSLLAISSRDLGVFCSYSLYRVFGTAVLVLSAFPPLTRYNIFLGITYVSGMFSSLILHYGLEYSYTLIFDMATGNLNGFTVECEYNVDWSG